MARKAKDEVSKEIEVMTQAEGGDNSEYDVLVDSPADDVTEYAKPQELWEGGDDVIPVTDGLHSDSGVVYGTVTDAEDSIMVDTDDVIDEPADLATGAELDDRAPEAESAPEYVYKLAEAVIEVPGTDDTMIAKPAVDMVIAEDIPAISGRKSIYELDLNMLDGNLNPEQAQEWSSIYASYRSRTILSGLVIGVDQNTFEVSGANGERQIKTIQSLIIIDYRVKVLIPESEIWIPDDERPQFVMRNMVGSTIDYVILDVDREGNCAIGSRRMALTLKRYFFARDKHQEDEKITCKVVSVGPKMCTVECNGYDIILTQRDLTYAAVPDLREKYRPGMEMSCLLKKYDKDAGELIISVKDTLPNPFDGAEDRHPIGSMRQAVIGGKYRGGVFCNLTDGTVCHCLYSSRHTDSDFRNGDTVLVSIRAFDYKKKQMFGRILTKW